MDVRKHGFETDRRCIEESADSLMFIVFHLMFLNQRTKSMAVTVRWYHIQPLSVTGIDFHGHIFQTAVRFHHQVIQQKHITDFLFCIFDLVILQSTDEGIYGKLVRTGRNGRKNGADGYGIGMLLCKARTDGHDFILVCAYFISAAYMQIKQFSNSSGKLVMNWIHMVWIITSFIQQEMVIFLDPCLFLIAFKHD